MYLRCQSQVSSLDIIPGTGVVGPSYEGFVSFDCVEHVRSYVTNAQFTFIIKEENHTHSYAAQFKKV